MSILFLDEVGSGFDGDTPKTRALGGSELAEVQLAEALAARGHDVHLLSAKDPNTTPRIINGVHYGHGVPFERITEVVCARETRRSKLPNVRCTVVSLTDMGPHTITPCDVLVGVSQWQLDRFAHVPATARRVVIPPIVETPPKLEKVPHRYIYASTRCKGLDVTLDAWWVLQPTLHPDAELVVAQSSDSPTLPGSYVESYPRVRFLGAVSPAQLREEIARASALFFVNTLCETFCVVAALAEAAGTTPIVYCPKGDPAGLREAITTPVHSTLASFAAAAASIPPCGAPKDYSVGRVVREWERALGLEHQAREAAE